MIQGHTSLRRNVEGCDWEAAKGQFVPWDDGHVPVNLRHTEDYQSTLLVRDPTYHQQHQSEVHTIDESVHESLVDAIYEYTVQQSTPWGAYVRIDQIQEEWNRHGTSCALPASSSISNTKETSSKEEMFVKVAAAYFHRVLQVFQDEKDHLASNVDAHGIAVWGLAAKEGSQVTYHLDYAEQLRYQCNVIVPPIYAGTLQCSKIANMEGGCYCVHTAGLQHYEKYGFKGKKSGYVSSTELLLNEEYLEGRWVTIPYRYNRMIVQRGHLPHLSTPIASLPPGQQRVIVGFNVFRHDVGPFVERAPEHSSAFRRRVALQGILERNMAGPALSLESVRSNPALAKLLVQAKRFQIKNELLFRQNELDERIDLILRKEGPKCVGDLIEGLARQDGDWPNADDVHVHIHRRCKEGRWMPLRQNESEPVQHKLMTTVALISLSETNNENVKR
ncbi:hypothetical protein FisN_25Hh156 [Fistulifera solaris]|uniref:Uncharacterized protein n=1 Tax=Fistulifera solaris TaxID=1519565 RepID=A0A1Z5JWF9_FISSO|nr:hypothetical protein FisN_25Hh156 [Fistulifera solaris]|eukprot:GAX18172.1 hypothetical protein FisN_25Hh156 [Fistulifera solaris]